ncbi:MAG: type II secretion system secretin GspD [Burkholderiaceae bacterium]|nr:type II secretion system secretin GspD [Burkholderiaceae bacterium]
MTFPNAPQRRFAIKTIATSAILASLTGQIHAQAGFSTTLGSVRAREPVTLNFANAEIEAVARTMATITGRNVVVDPRVKGQLNLVTENPVPPGAAYQQFLAALRLQGFTVVESAGLYKVVPEADAKLQGGSVSVSQGGGLGGAPEGGQIVTQIFKLNFENANNLVPVLRPLISPNNTINVNPGNNSLVITDYADNLQRLARIVAAMDVANATDVEIIPLKNAIATELVPLVARLIDGSSGGQAAAAGQGQADTSFKTTLLAEPRSNALILRAANPARIAQVRALVDKLDQPFAGSAAHGNIHVVHLKNAEATKLAATLRAAMAGMGGSASGASAFTGSALTGSTPNIPNPTSPLGGSGGVGQSLGQGGFSSNSNQPSTGGQIQADPTTNSLIITAPDPVYRQLRTVIDQLDSRRAQVLVESLVVEVNAKKAAEFGIQWQSLLGNNGGTNVGVIGTNSSQGGANIIDLAIAAATGSVTGVRPSTGLNFGIGHKYNGGYALSFLARFLESTGDGNVLSTPNLLTLDNEEAKIVIGQNVPFVTGQYTNNNSNSGSVNPFQTIERKDVGLSLRVRPQISENGTVKMQVFQEVSDVVASTVNDARGPTTSKRSIESSVLVEDGSIVVLGGLLQDRFSGGEERVPLLGDVPVLGNLFRNQARSREKTNLMVFLRPVVIRDAATSTAVSMDRYDQIRGMQERSQPSDSTVLRSVNGAPVLPPLGAARAPEAPVRPADAPETPRQP